MMRLFRGNKLSKGNPAVRLPRSKVTAVGLDRDVIRNMHVMIGRSESWRGKRPMRRAVPREIGRAS